MLTIFSAIVSSRKRKLRELFAIATEADGIPNPNYDLTDPDAPPTTAAEAQFLLECDILRYACSTPRSVFV